MEAMINGWISFPNQDSAIRQFCPARMEQVQEREWGLMLLDEEDEIAIWPNIINDETPQLEPSEVDELVDTFFNVECYAKDNADKNYQFQEEGLQDVSMINDVYHGSNVPMMIEGDEFEGSSSSDDLCCSGAGLEGVIRKGVDQGLHLVHLLLACAEAVGCRDTQLADTVLNQIWPCVSPWGDSLQRVAHYFAVGLKSRLSFLRNVSPNGSFSCGTNADVHHPVIPREERREAFNLLHQNTPYIAFGVMAVNDAIFQASMGRDTLHIVDLGMEHNLQWPCLVKNLASRDGGPPKTIRFTGIVGNQDSFELENSLRGLCEFACSIGICFEFQLVKESVSPSSLIQEKLDLREGEALFVNSMMQLHKHVKESRGSLKTILQSIKKLNPLLLTVVEQDANHNGPFFLGRFLESLHYYSAIFDSLEASLPRSSPDRVKIENCHYGEELRNVVAYEGHDRIERHERADQWRRHIGRAGFHAVGLKCLSQTKLMVSGYNCDGYTVTSEKGCIQLGWNGRPIMLASAWQVNINVPS